MPDDPFVTASISTFAAKRPNTVFRCCLSLCFATDGAEDEDDEAPTEGRGAERVIAEDEDDEPLPEGEDEARGRGGNAGGAASSLIETNVSRYLSLVCVLRRYRGGGGERQAGEDKEGGLVFALLGRSR